MLQLTPDPSNPDAALLVGSAANAVWAYDLALPFLGAAVDGLRTRGRLGMLAQALAAQAWAAVHLAREPLAVSAAEEAISLARETGQLQWAVVAELAKAAIAAERGDLGDAEVMAGRAEVSITQMGAKPMLAMAQFVRGRGAMVQGRFAEGFEHLRRALDPSDASYHPFIGSWGLSDMVEAAVRLDRKADAALYLNELRMLAAETSGSLLLAALAYAEAVAANDDAAAPLFAQAAGIDLINWPCYRGRIQLGYGRWLRRQRRVAESRSRLRAALEIFDALAFPSLAKVARDELRAAGEKTEQEAPDAWLLLTPQELQIAQLASEGETNRAIGAQLYLSPRTVQSHLYKIFPKLGITARSQLRDVLMERAVA
jgi:ATP/maltotriose-dependent transcriptional regulator MalT